MLELFAYYFKIRRDMASPWGVLNGYDKYEGYVRLPISDIWVPPE